MRPPRLLDFFPCSFLLTPPSVVSFCGYPLPTCFLLGFDLSLPLHFLATRLLGVMTFPSRVLQLVSTPNQHASLNDLTCLFT
jgi:hypothetical protein